MIHQPSCVELRSSSGPVRGIQRGDRLPFIRPSSPHVPLRSPVAPDLHVLFQAGGREAWGILDAKLVLEHAIEMGRTGAYPEADAALHARKLYRQG